MDKKTKVGVNKGIGFFIYPNPNLINLIQTCGNLENETTIKLCIN